MPKQVQRHNPLSPAEQKHFVDVVIPGRIEVISACLREPEPSDPLLAAAAIHTRALASFLGIGVVNGKVTEDHRHYDHGDGSYEVKISDLQGGALFTKEELLQLDKGDREAIRSGFITVNCEFAHLTYWRDPENQDTRGGPVASYRPALISRVRTFADTIIRLVRSRVPAAP